MSITENEGLSIPNKIETYLEIFESYQHYCRKGKRKKWLDCYLSVYKELLFGRVSNKAVYNFNCDKDGYVLKAKVNIDKELLVYRELSLFRSLSKVLNTHSGTRVNVNFESKIN